MKTESSHGVAQDNSPRRKPWDQGEKAASPGRGDRKLRFRIGFLSPLRGLETATFKPTAGAMG